MVPDSYKKIWDEIGETGTRLICTCFWLRQILRLLIEGTILVQGMLALNLRRRVWFDKRTANAICTACFHPSSKIMNAALSFLLGDGVDGNFKFVVVILVKVLVVTCS
ncbi:hypothetical protein MKW98_001038 [Papaver atlanticum]|uniref:Protein SDA1 n=1 Tax=Papaver atlanticum TaxID=357466 RepID=A0AAD4X5J9_9MAGN|nr:hypothetical protein MKW98_001038 [Papaver atlanticum]